MSGSLPSASAGVQFRKKRPTALSFQKPDLVPDLIPPGGASWGPVPPQHLADFSCFSGCLL
ncbi:hypothetical protein EYF80_024259 [Liparis tanakae]|uniref:Uncharacterized protein n=1 Tax=Liparis tanakae TaxID=230148 RepID=A0A4Z2HJ10_9TELE|nr:hypothetical protein EYF80_024259 [Liparis tanakae]